MDADVYLAEHMIRDRLADARARAEFAALLGEPNPRSLPANGLGRRLLELGGRLSRGGDERRPVLDGSSKEGRSMTYTVKPLTCDPTTLKGLSVQVILGHWAD